MAAHNGHDEQHQRLSVHTKQHGCREQRWRHHNQRGHHLDGRTVHVATHSCEEL